MKDTDNQAAPTIPSTDLRVTTESGPSQPLWQRTDRVACDTPAQSSIGDCTVCASGQIQAANLAAANLLGLSLGELIGQPLSRFIVSEDQNIFALLLRSLFEAPTPSAADSGSAAGPVGCTLQIRQPDGAILWTRIDATAASDADGLPVCRVTLSDITLGKDTDAQRDSEEQLTLALDAAELGTYDWDIAANRILWSQRHESLWGLAPGAFDGTYEGFLSRLHPDDAPEVAEELARCMTTRERFSRDFRVVWPDGSLHWMQGLGEFSVDSTGQPQRMRGCVMEITARKEAELELRRFQQIVETSRDMLMFVDCDLRFKVVNPAYAERFQTTPRALQGCLVSEVVGEHLYVRIAPELQAALSGEIRRFSVEFAGLDGQRIDLDATYSPFWEDGRVQGIVVCLHDVTETKAAWAALEAERAHLEDQVAERTAALQASEGMLRTLFDLLPLGIAITDRSGRVVHCNRASEKLLGITRDEHLQRHHTGSRWSIIRPDGTPLPEDEDPSVRAMVEQRPVHDVEMGIVKPDGVTWLSVSATPPVHTDYGAIIAYVDITARRQSEAALRASEQRWQFALDGAGDGIWDWHIPSGRVFFSHGWKAMLGYGDEEIEDRIEAWEQQVHPEDLPRALEDVQAHLDGKTPVYENEHRMRCHDGGWKWILDRGKVMERGANGQPLRMIGTHKDISEHKQAEDRLKASQARFERLAHYDALTGLPNRLLLADRLQHAMAQTQRREKRLAVVYLDLDGFKAVNDRHGHAVGDQLLVAVATQMKQALREGDTIARLGGDEFVAVLIDLEYTEAIKPQLNRLLAAAAAPIALGDLVVQVSASLGVAVYPLPEEVSADQLLRQADQAMYQAKLSGKNRYHVFDVEQAHRLHVEHDRLERIRRALTEREFVLYYQPKVNLRSGEVIGAEALIRWQHPTRGLLLPQAFLPAIEDDVLATGLGEWVIETALTQMEHWRASGVDLPVSVNVGPRQLQQADFIARLRAQLAAHPGVKPSSLALEIEELSARQDLDQVSRVVADCRELGVSCALDDCGIGDASSTYLKELAVTALKIDRSFVGEMLNHPEDLAIIERILGLAKAFRLETIAEGAETQAQRERLLQLGCDLAQGYGIAHPMPADAVISWLADWRSAPH